MKVGILTFHFSDNFGALLQAYALQKWFADHGHQAHFINYSPAHVEAGGAFNFSLSRAALKSNAKVAYLKVTSLIHRLFGDKSQALQFSRFRSGVLGVTAPEVETESELREAVRSFDLLVAGSDQIWSHSVQRGFDPVYFLNFARDLSLRRVSYAASFGRDFLTPQQIKELKPLVESLSSVSIRELSALKMLEQVGRPAVCVPDPTLLHTDYSRLLSLADKTELRHVFCYALRTGSGIREVATAVAAKVGAEIISPYNVHRRWRQIGRTVYPGPAEWVQHLASAEFVVTNSFHGAVFSILFKKRFLVVALSGSRAELNSRSRNLLTQLGLMSRFVADPQSAPLEQLIEAPIDWAEVEVKQQALRRAGQQFLNEQIAEVERLG